MSDIAEKLLAEEGPSPSRPARDFWQFVDKNQPNGCWLWTGTTNMRGYGTWSQPGFRGLAHRWSYKLAHGDLPDGLFICHHCDCPPCVNPSHLYAGTHRQNMTDAVNRGRTANANTYKTHCKEGHELAGDNLIVREDPRGRTSRSCRTCTRARTREFLRRRGRQAGVGSRPDVTDIERRKICDLRRSGTSHRKIARMTGRALTTVQRVLKGAGL